MPTLSRRALLLAGLGIALALAQSACQAPPKPPSLDRYGDPLPEGAIARLGTIRLRHFWGASSPVLSRDGRVLMAGDQDILRFWDTTSGKEIRHFDAKIGQIRVMKTSPDGKHLAVAAGGGMGVWEVSSGKRLSFFVGQKGHTDTVAFSPDGRILVSGGYGNAIYFWDVSAGKLVKTLYPPGSHSERMINGKPVGGSVANTVEEVHYSPDGRTLVSLSRHSERQCFYWLQTWDLSTDKERGQARKLTDLQGDIIAPDGRRVFIERKTGLNVVDLESGKERPFPVSGLTVVAFSPDGTRLLAQHQDGRVSLVDSHSGKELLPLLPFANWVRGAGFTHDGKMLVFSQGHAIRLWDTVTGKEICPFGPVPNSIGALAFLADGKTLISADSEGWIHLWEAGTGKEIRRFKGHPPGRASLTLCAGGKTLAVTTSTRQECKERVNLVMWDLAAGKETKRFARDSLVSPDGKMLACTEKQDSIVLLDAVTEKEIRRLAKAGYPRLFSPDGRVLATFGVEGNICLWDVATGRLRRTLGRAQDDWMYKDSAHFLSFSPDGKTLAIVWSGHFKPGDLEVWDVATGRRLAHRPNGIRGCIGATCFSPDGRVLFLRSDDYKEVVIEAYDPLADRVLGRMAEYQKEDTGFRGYPQDITIAPDGRLLASLLPGGTALVWDISHLTAQGR